MSQVKKRYRPDKDGKDKTLFNHYKNEIKAMQPPCGICGLPIDYELPGTDQWGFTLDHIIPIIKGGTTTRENLQAAHRKCNRTKGDRISITPAELIILRESQMYPRIDDSPGYVIKRKPTPLFNFKGADNIPGQYTQAEKGLPQSQNWRTY